MVFSNFGIRLDLFDLHRFSDNVSFMSLSKSTNIMLMHGEQKTLKILKNSSYIAVK